MWDDREKIVQASWSSPMTNKLLLEAGLSSLNSRWGGQAPAGSATSSAPIWKMASASPVAQSPCSPQVSMPVRPSKPSMA